MAVVTVLVTQLTNHFFLRVLLAYHYIHLNTQVQFDEDVQHLAREVVCIHPSKKHQDVVHLAGSDLHLVPHGFELRTQQRKAWA
jgi:hypothetical protein